MCDLVCDRYPVLLIMSRFGIALGFGDKTIGEVCLDSGVDTATFLAVVNMHADDKAPDPETISVAALVSYLRNSHNYFLDFRLPAIRRKLIEAIDCSHNDVAFAILRFFDEYVADYSILPIIPITLCIILMVRMDIPGAYIRRI